jgi:hypothetical protein
MVRCFFSAPRYLAAQGTCHQTNCTKVVPQGSIPGFKDVSAKAKTRRLGFVADQGTNKNHQKMPLLSHEYAMIG